MNHIVTISSALTVRNDLVRKKIQAALLGQMDELVSTLAPINRENLRPIGVRAAACPV